MTDGRDRFDADGELISAWLAGELDPPAAEEVERRLRAEPDLAARVDRVHDTLVALRGLDAVEPPPGMDERLRQRLAAERSPRPVSSLTERRAARRSWRLPALGAAAAVLVLLAVIPVLTRTLPTARLGGDATGEADVSVERAEPQALESEQEAATAADEAAGEQQAAALEGAGPVITESADASARAYGPSDLEASLSDQLGKVPEATELLGLPLADARRLGAEYAAAIRSATPFTTIDAAPSTCLDEVLADREVAVPARVEGLSSQETGTLAYVLVVATPGSAVLDAVTVQVVNAATCAAL
jgi:hypothetical protein